MERPRLRLGAAEAVDPRLSERRQRFAARWDATVVFSTPRGYGFRSRQDRLRTGSNA